eukprot:GHVS01068989.1.p1 GENE.GHVS01068989.1~~GHVS01068989.1.p1  ORF type:complete len:475 (+),score=34.48 GHVS01068989.1:254-1678(+)
MLPALFRYVLCHMLVLFAATANPPKPLLMDLSAVAELPIQWYRKRPNATSEIKSVVEQLPIGDTRALPWLVFLRLMEEQPTGWLEELNMYKNDEYPLVKIVGEVDIISSAVTMSVTTNDSTTEVAVAGSYWCKEQKCFVTVVRFGPDYTPLDHIYFEPITTEELGARIGLAFATIHVIDSAAVGQTTSNHVHPLMLVHVWAFGQREGHPRTVGMIALVGGEETQLSDGWGRMRSWRYAVLMDSGKFFCSRVEDYSLHLVDLFAKIWTDIGTFYRYISDAGGKIAGEHAFRALFHILKDRSEFHDKRRHLDNLLEVPLGNRSHQNDFIMFPLSALKALLSTFGVYITALEKFNKATITGTTGIGEFMELLLSTSLVSNIVHFFEPRLKCKVGVNSKVVDRISELKKLLENDPKLTSAVKEYKNGILLKILWESEQALSDFKPNEADVLFDINTREGLEGYLAALDKPQQQATSPP